VSQSRLCRDLANLGWNLCRIIFNLQSIADKMSNTPQSNGTLSYSRDSSDKDMSFSPVLGSEISSKQQLLVKKEEVSSDEKGIADKMPDTPQSNGTLSYSRDSSEKDMSFSPVLGSESSSEKQLLVKKEEDSSDEKGEVDAKTPYEQKSIRAKNEEHRGHKIFTPMEEVFGNHPSSQKVARFAKDSPDKHKNPNVPDNSKTQRADFSDYSCNGCFEEARIILEEGGKKKRLAKVFKRIYIDKYVKRNTKRNTGPSVLENRLSEDIRVDELSQKRPKKGR